MNVTEQRLEIKATELKKQLDAAKQRIKELVPKCNSLTVENVSLSEAKEEAERKLATARIAARKATDFIESAMTSYLNGIRPNSLDASEVLQALAHSSSSTRRTKKSRNWRTTPKLQP